MTNTTTIEQATQMLKDRIARFKRDHAYIWERPSKLDVEKPKETMAREQSPAEQMKKDMGF